MLAARIHEWGQEPVLEEVPEPELRPGHSVVEVTAAAVAHLDLTVAGGEFPLRPPLPYIPGAEGAGRIIASERFPANASVRIRGAGVGVERDGLWAERALVPDEALQVVDEQLPAPLVASYFANCATPYAALHDVGRLQAGERVLVTGAGGAVGRVAVQLASAAGAEVLGIEADAERAAAIPAGAVRLVGSDPEDLLAELRALGPADLLVDLVGGALLPRLLTGALRPGARAVLVGYVAGTRLEIELPALIDADVRLLPMNLMHRGDGLEAAARELLALIAGGELTLSLDELPLRELPLALARLRDGGGRFVVVP
ncbi:MAG: zinc-binding alcohol dehydrogenase family protein [Actinobacteria bacterium]|nr:zinc-binding alcohol dehydrogenase family protein [Actinomycetota bacterium]